MNYPLCGYALKDDDVYCRNCGARIEAGPGAVQDAPEVYPKAGPGAIQEPMPLAGNQPAPKGAAGKNSYLPFIAAGGVGLVVIAGLLFFAMQGSRPSGHVTSQPAASTAQSSAVTATSAPASSPSSASSSTPASSAPATQTQPTLSPEEQFIKSLDGWWTYAVSQTTYGDGLSYIHDGVMDSYKSTGEFISNYRTIAPDDVVRFDNGLGPSGVLGPGWFIYGVGKSESGMYVSDKDPDSLSMVNIDGTNYRGGDTLGRVDAPEWAASVVGTSTVSATPSPSASDTAAAATPQVNEGEVLLSGTVVSTTASQRQADLGLPESTGFANDHKPLVFLQLDSEIQIDARNGDGRGRSTRPASSVLLNESWASRGGEHVNLAVPADGFSWFSDVLGALVSVGIIDVNNVREL